MTELYSDSSIGIVLILESFGSPGLTPSLIHLSLPDLSFDKIASYSDCAVQTPNTKISMDSRNKDNIWIERFGKAIKYEYIYIQL